MSDWPLLGGGRYEHAGPNTADSEAVTLTITTVNTKGAYVELIASTAFEAQGIFVMWKVDNVGNPTLTDIAVGVAASEQVIAADLFADTADPDMMQHVYLPIAIPAGSRIAARLQGANSTLTRVDISVLLCGISFLPSAALGQIETNGQNGADSGGVQIDPGGTANTKGSWTQLTASTGIHFRYLIAILGCRDNVAQGNSNFLVDVAVGAAGSEQVILPNIRYQNQPAADVPSGQIMGPFPVNIPPGTRLSVRAQSNVIDTIDRLFDCVLYGVG